ncbi:MAPK/MAK/MRK overlapping kinase [Oryzias melastigma]|uniref:MAPK/MAK/MRK overlapping kinase n=1 Tax=Oryzias melastigma TaxID=30732 RepID=A0A834F8S1_ORYME|nr:MAPK/MAK/MRK overlapping kinase [Oryzias melastigma]
MHYSNWLIDIKNKASLRNEYQTSFSANWNHRGDSADMENSSKRPNERTSELVIHNHLWKRGYKIIKKLGEGAFSEVVKTQSLKDGKFYACKTMKQTIKSLEQANKLQEVQAMKRLSPHANIIQLHELIFDKVTGTLSLICELMEMNIYEFLQKRKKPLPDHMVKNYMYQLCKSLQHMHSCGIFHRDVKPENILIKQNVLKLGDFGSCRSVYSKPPHTEYISTRWYRAPECLLTDGYYNLKMDIWSAGCVFFEIMSLKPLFPGANELDQVAKIHNVLGTPDQSLLQKFKQTRAMCFNFPPMKGTGISRLIPHCPAPALSLLYQMLAYDPDERISAETALRHTYFREIRMTEKKTETSHFLFGTLDAAGNRLTQQSLEKIWRPSSFGKQLKGRYMRQTPLMSHKMKHKTDPLIRHNTPHYLPPLSKMKKVVPGPQRSFQVCPSPAFTSDNREVLPPIVTKKCQQHPLKPQNESQQPVPMLPPLIRKHENT